MDQIANWLDRHDVNLVLVLITLGIVIGTSGFVFLAKRLLRARLWKLQGRLHLPYETALIILRVCTAVLWIIVATIILQIWGVGVGGFWTLLVSAATVIGVGFLATWTMVSNITASLFLSIWRPFHLGDTLELLPESLKGRVIDRNLMFVALREPTGSVIRIPNNLFFQKMFRVIDGADRSLFETLEAK